jgi:hydrogenase-4 component E
MDLGNSSLIDLVLIGIVLANLLLLGSSRLVTYIQISAFQGFIVSAMTLVFCRGEISLRLVVLAVGAAILKAGVFPWLLLRAIRKANIKAEIEPIVGYSASILAGVLILALSIWLVSRLSIPVNGTLPFVMTVSFFTIFTGCFLLVGRTKAITQVISYLVLENGIYLFGVSFVGNVNILIELGVILDLTVGIFVMGIIVHHISREFDSLDMRKLSTLKDWGS